MAEKKQEVDKELEAVRARYPADAVIERRFSGNIRVQLKDGAALASEHSGAQLAGFTKGGA